MRVLTVRQPYAWLIVNGYKNIENRVWRTHHRGSLLIQASARLARNIPAIRAICESRGISLPRDFERRGIVGRANVTDCVTDHSSPWFEGPYGFVLQDATPLPFVPLVGRLGMFDFDCQPMPERRLLQSTFLLNPVRRTRYGRPLRVQFTP